MMTHLLPRIALAASLVTLVLPSGARSAPSPFADRVMEAIAPPSDSSGPVRDVARWGGRLFVQCETRTWWTSDGGATWKSRDWFKDGPKGSAPALDKAWFTRAAGGIWLGNRNGPLAWSFDTAAGAWVECPAGLGAIAAAGSGDRLYALAGGNELRLSRDAGVTWSPVPVPDSVRVGSFFDDILADGDAVALRSRDLANSQRPAFTPDGGRTWTWLPARAPLALSRGCAFAADGARLVSACPGGRAGEDVPYASALALFAGPAGAIFAWADSSLHARAAAGEWTVLATREDLRGWERTRDLLFCLRGGTLSWFTGAPAATAIRALPARARAAADHQGLWCLRRGFRHDAAGRRLSPHP